MSPDEQQARAERHHISNWILLVLLGVLVFVLMLMLFKDYLINMVFKNAEAPTLETEQPLGGLSAEEIQQRLKAMAAEQNGAPGLMPETIEHKLGELEAGASTTPPLSAIDIQARLNELEAQQ